MEPVDTPQPDRPDGPGPDKPQAPLRPEAHEKLFPGSRLDRFKEWLSAVWVRIRARPVTSIAIASVSLVVLVGVAGWTYLFAGMPRMPSADDLWTINRKPSVQFVDATGQLVAARGPRYGSIVRAKDLPSYVSEAFVAAEDQRFFEHSGVDWQSVTRAVVANVSAGHTEQGGSTLTQQLVKNTLLDDQRTLRRKAQEAVLAADMETQLSKHEILDLYLNRVYLGSNSFGVEAAAQTYFGVPAAKLTLKQAAFLAALPKAPSRYAEHKTDKEVMERVDYVLDQMVEANFITGKESRQASAEKLAFVEEPKLAGVSGYVLDAATEEARRVMPAFPPDAVIVLTIDAALQKQAEKSLEAALRVKGLGAKEGAIVVMEPSGAVKALVGGRDYQKVAI
jgi:penicillin-binding protein 1A